MTRRVVSNFIESNVFVVGDDKVCIIVDAAAEIEAVKNAVEGRKVLGVFLTHGHYDHALYSLLYAQTFGCKIYASKFIEEYLRNPDWNYSEGKFLIDNFSDFVFLGKAGKVKLDGMEVEYKQLGGHSKSDMMYQVGYEIFVGDVLIGRDMGRIDLYGGSKEEMKKSLKVLAESQYSIMHSGHGSDNNKQTQDKVAKLWIKFLER